MTDRRQSVIVRELFDDANPKEQKRLRADPCEWADDLADLIASIESQLERADRQLEEYREAVFAELTATGEGNAAAWAEYEAEQQRVAEWRRRTKTILKRAKTRRRRVLRYAEEATQAARDASAERLLRELLLEVERHREAVTEDEPDPCDADHDLWAAADRARDRVRDLERTG